MLEFYGYDRCSTCLDAKKWLDDRGIKYRDIPIVDRPPSKALLKRILKADGYTLKNLFNTSGQVYREQGVKDKLVSMTEDQALALLAGQGKLCKRPIVTDGRSHTVGFKPAVFDSVWG